MANQSIYRAFERMWQHVANALSTKVSVDRKINGKELKEDITLSAIDIGLTNVLLIESFDCSTVVLNTRSYDYNS